MEPEVVQEAVVVASLVELEAVEEALEAVVQPELPLV